MNSRAVEERLPDLIITVVLAAYGIYVASYLPALFVVPEPFLLIVRLVEAVLAFAGAYGVWTGRPWAPATLLALGITIALMWLIEAFVYGIVPYLEALGGAIIAAVAGVFTAFYVQHHRRRLVQP